MIVQMSVPSERKEELTMLKGELSIPNCPRGVVLFAHGGGSSMLSPRNRTVANSIYDEQIATLLLDLLNDKEKEKDRITYEYRFNVGLLGMRVIAVVKWLRENKNTSSLGIGVFGSSTGAAAALIAASQNSWIKAIVSRGGRPDLVDRNVLRIIKTPTLFIVGENDKRILLVTKQVFEDLGNMEKKKLSVIPAAGHLFEEPGSMENMSAVTVEWFKDCLVPS
jgi:putative phosphoribosyl transferase